MLPQSGLIYRYKQTHGDSRLSSSRNRGSIPDQARLANSPRLRFVEAGASAKRVGNDNALPLSPTTFAIPRQTRKFSIPGIRTSLIPGISSHASRWSSTLGIGMIAIAIGGVTGPLTPVLRMESGYYLSQIKTSIPRLAIPGIRISLIPGIFGKQASPLPKSVPVIFNPLVADDGASIDPKDTNFGLIIPKIGVNTKVIPAVNPADPKEYDEALKTAVAHASTSYFPDENGTVFLFSHSTGYDWFVRDLNAVFYLIKNLKEGDLIVLFYKGKRYTYRLRETRVVAASEVSYLSPQAGKKSLILETCWPPGSTDKRMLLFADLIEEYGNQI